ncbi:MAG: diadenylate cyclase [bacterium]|nr:diadenylate cyclase [bacterium]MDZ4206020.1 diadenylate cyclase [Patescibacteria group bacterium]
MTKLLIASTFIPVNFFSFSIEFRDYLDMIVVAFLIYVIILLFKKTHSFFLFNGITVLVLIYIFARYFGLYLTSYLFSFFFGFFVIIFIVVFQRELRRLFEWLSLWRRFPYSKRELIPDFVSIQVIEAVIALASAKIGAIIVFPGEDHLDLLAAGGIPLGGRVSAELLQSIFDPSSPGHDGAVIVQGDRIRSFGAHLPLARQGIKKFGTRHRAALGLAERSDAFIIIVSEEMGTISIAEDGDIKVLHEDSITDELPARLHDFLRKHLLDGDTQSKKWYPLINWKEKLASLFIAFFLWYAFVVQLGAGTITRNFQVPIEFSSLPAEYLIENINPTEINISLSGKNQDFSFLNSDRLKVSINLEGGVEGKQKFEITKNDIVGAPDSLSIINFTPKTIQFSIKKSRL